MTELYRAIIEQLFEQFKLILKAILSEPKANAVKQAEGKETGVFSSCTMFLTSFCFIF
jgi:hypothetical protein